MFPDPPDEPLQASVYGREASLFRREPRRLNSVFGLTIGAVTDY
jgi:hypothetical protein